MSIEIPNSLEAAGWFDGFTPPANPNPIFSSNGIQTFDPATTPADPVGGFTRLGTAAYLVQLVRSIDILESICVVTCFPTIDKGVHLCAAVVPGDEGDGTVLIFGDPLGDDDFFQLGVFRFLSDLSGTQPITAPAP